MIIRPEENVFDMVGLPGSDPYANRLVIEYETLGLSNAMMVPESRDERTKGPGGYLVSDVWIGYQARQPENYEKPDPVSGPDKLPDIRMPKEKKLSTIEIENLNIVQAKHQFEALSGGGVSQAQRMMNAQKKRMTMEFNDGNLDEYIDPEVFNFVNKRTERDHLDDTKIKIKKGHEIDRTAQRQRKINIVDAKPNLKARRRMLEAWKREHGDKWDKPDDLNDITVSSISEE